MTNLNSICKVILLEAICYVPIVIIAGNILPALGPFKIHWMYIGIIFLLTVVLLSTKKTAKNLLIILLLFSIAQMATAIKFSVADYIDFLSGPLLFVVIVNILKDNNISSLKLQQIRKKMLIAFAVPIAIAFLQYLKVIPLEFLNAKYVNVTVYGTEEIERVNGFLYHGIELAVIIFFFFISIGLFKSGLGMYTSLLLMAFFEFVITIKAAIIAAILFTGFFSYFIDRRLRWAKTLLIITVVLVGFSYLYILVPDLQGNRFHFNQGQFRFDDQLFTGRGFIWNTYLDGISHFNVFQIIFGGGYGSAPIIFEENAPGRVEWSAGTHNQLLELFINGGVVSILLIIMILKKQYTKLSFIFEENKEKFFHSFLGLLVIPLITMGLTSPIMSMFIYWCGLSLAMITIRLKFGLSDQAQLPMKETEIIG